MQKKCCLRCVKDSGCHENKLVFIAQAQRQREKRKGKARKFIRHNEDWQHVTQPFYEHIFFIFSAFFLGERECWKKCAIFSPLPQHVDLFYACHTQSTLFCWWSPRIIRRRSRQYRMAFVICNEQKSYMCARKWVRRRSSKYQSYMKYNSTICWCYWRGANGAVCAPKTNNFSIKCGISCKSIDVQRK